MIFPSFQEFTQNKTKSKYFLIRLLLRKEKLYTLLLVHSNSIVIDVLRKALDRVMLKCFLNIYGNVQKSLLHVYLNLYKSYLSDDVLIINGNVNAEQSSKCENVKNYFLRLRSAEAYKLASVIFVVDI